MVCVMYSGNDSYGVEMRGVARQDGNFFLSLAEMSGVGKRDAYRRYRVTGGGGGLLDGEVWLEQ
jgi:hypothetical protein